MVRGPISQTTVIDPASGMGQNYVVFDYPQTIDELYTQPLTFIEGQQIQVQEIVKLFFEILDETLIDTDLTWYGGKKYLGTWRLNTGTIIPQVTEGDEGYVTSQYFSIIRYSTYVVTPRRGANDGIFGAASIDDCSFTLAPFEGILPGLPSIPLRYRPENQVQIFVADTSIEFHPLLTSQFFPKIVDVSLYTPPGARLSSATYDRSVINEVALSRPVVIPVAPCYPRPANCKQELNQFVTRDGLPYAAFTEIDAIVAEYYSGEPDSPQNGGPSRVRPANFRCSTGELLPYFTWAPFAPP